jgi:hypothetical protein
MRQLPSYPLFTKDPFFSLWMPHDILNECDVENWFGERKRIYGIIKMDGKPFLFLGNLANIDKLKQTKLELTSFETKYIFDSEWFSLKVSFISPLLLNKLDILSNPTTIFSYEIFPKVDAEFEIALFINEEICYNAHLGKKQVRTDILRYDMELCYVGVDDQRVLSHSADKIGADWGYYYLSGESCGVFSSDEINKYLDKHVILKEDDSIYIVSFNKSLKGNIYLAFDDIISIYYFGFPLKGYYFKDGKTIIDAIFETNKMVDKIKVMIEEFDRDLVSKTKKYHPAYINILRAALRQSIASHKLVEHQGKLLWLSKECSSAGCVATVDVSFPSSPLFLLYNSKLVLGMLYPIFEFALTDAWPYQFAPHDAGMYPYVNGQYYGINVKEGKYQNSIDFNNGLLGVLPPYYLYPKNSNLYKLERQMPIEESSNMLILSALVLKNGEGKKELNNYFNLLTKWADYIFDKGLIPENQLCTDDFAGHLDKNINLSIKATIALASFDIIAKSLGKEISSKYLIEAQRRADEIQNISGHLPLVFGGDKQTFSLKYNFFPDIILGTNLFNQKIIEREIDFYLLKANNYGIPLDSRNTYTKSDWLMWVCAITTNKKAQDYIIKSIDMFLKETPRRIPFSDWYDTKTAKLPSKKDEFHNRPVQGGLFAPLLKDVLYDK